MKILVLAHEKDDHAAPIKWALEQGGYEVVCWSGVSWTEREQAALFVDEQPRVILGHHCLEADDAVWLRQPDQPVQRPAESNAAGKSTGSEYLSFFDSIAYLLEGLPVRCINRFSASCLIRNKAIQLQVARSAGLRIPATLMSNSPLAVREFFGQSQHRTVCKSFSPHIWQQQGAEDLAVTGTFELSGEDLPANEVLTYAPAIYQHRVTKQFDVRTVLMGQQIHSYAVRTAKNTLDWRHDAILGKIEVKAIPTPVDVEQGILDFAAKTGACFGSMDFAVDANGEWWFLEINEQGQFLWLDEFVPEGRLQQKFCAFITAPVGSTPRSEAEEDMFPSFAEYTKSHKRQQALNAATLAPGSAHKSLEP